MINNLKQELHENGKVKFKISGITGCFGEKNGKGKFLPPREH